MSIVDTIKGYKERYDDMDPFRRTQLQMAIILILIILISAYFIAGSIDTVKDFLGR